MLRATMRGNTLAAGSAASGCGGAADPGCSSAVPPDAGAIAAAVERRRPAFEPTGDGPERGHAASGAPISSMPWRSAAAASIRC